MKKRSVAANLGDVGVQFKHADASRIASVVRQVETARREGNPSKLPRAAGGGGIKEGTFCGAWPKGQSKEVTLVADTAATTLVFNFLYSIQPISQQENSTRYCLFTGSMRAGAENTLVSAEE